MNQIIYREVRNLNDTDVQMVRKAILSAIKSAPNRCHGLANAVEQILPVTRRDEAESTWSVYFKLTEGTRIRISDHSSGIWIGFHNRNNTSDQIELNATWPASKLAVKLLSIKKCLEANA